MMIHITGERVHIHETEEQHLEDLQALWNEPCVMKWVGYPEGLNIQMDQMSGWFARLHSSHHKQHFVIYDPDMSFCGELYFEIDTDHRAGLDIKLLSSAQGKGYATEALQLLISFIFENYADVNCVWTEPARINTHARELYRRCGLTDTYVAADENKERTCWELKRASSGAS